MNLLSKIKLSWRFGKVSYIISAVISVVMAVYVLLSPTMIAACIPIKLICIPVILYLNASLTKGMSLYFYLNLGISRKEYYLMPFAVEFIIFVLLMVISVTIGYAIG